MNDLSATTTIVVGASRGLGYGIATAFAEVGAPVVAVSRTAAAFPEPANGAGTIQPELADAGDATVAGRLLDRYEPGAVILVAGASPHMRPLQHQTWETFSVNWQTDVRITFTTVLPWFAPLTGVGRPAVRAYAARAGQSVEEFLQPMDRWVTPEPGAYALIPLLPPGHIKHA
jgi:hypothetical protein